MDIKIYGSFEVLNNNINSKTKKSHFVVWSVY